MASNADMSAVTVTTATIGSTADASAIGDVIDNIDTAIDTVNDKRATFGATQSRFEAVIANLQVSVENQSAARSRIMDADFAVETANLSRAQILQQAGNAMIAQANQLPQQVLCAVAVSDHSAPAGPSRRPAPLRPPSFPRAAFFISCAGDNAPP
jgi:flagellin